MGHDHTDMIWRSAAFERVARLREDALEETPTKTVPIDEITGRTVAKAVVAEENLPANDHATMDGYAFDARSGYPYRVVDTEIFPEQEPPAIESDEAIRIATGAPLPERANAVLKREEATVDDGYLTGTSTEPGTYVYERGSNVAQGETLLDAGERLSPKDAILLGDIGLETVSVHERFDVGVLATGTEIHEGRQSDLDSAMLAGLTRSWGHRATYEGTTPDEYEMVESAIDDLASEYDVVLTTGGTSVGHKDYVVRALEALGNIRFHRVKVRPGKPIAAARLSDHDCVVFAIPGKPIGAHTIATIIVRPFFTADTSLPAVDATLVRDVEIGEPGFEYAIPVRLDTGEAMPLGHVDSRLAVYEGTFDPSVLSSSTRASRADGFVLTESDLLNGDSVEVIPYPVVE